MPGAQARHPEQAPWSDANDTLAKQMEQCEAHLRGGLYVRQPYVHRSKPQLNSTSPARELAALRNEAVVVRSLNVFELVSIRLRRPVEVRQVALVR